MRTVWSKDWSSSKQPRKQRKYAFKAPPHIKHKKLRAPLSKELKKRYKKSALGVRVGDEVKILKGDFKGKTGKVDKVVKKSEAVVKARKI